MIRYTNATKVYESVAKKVVAVDNVTMHIEEGQICVFLGPSGCGKTTLLRMTNKLIPKTSGTIEIGGKEIDTLNVIELRRSIGYVIQQVGLFPNMTIEQNIGVVPNLLGWDRVKIKKRYEYLMELVGLNPDEYRKRYPWELSGGQQQRVGVARALAADPPVMLMDEPFGALDPIIRERLQNEFLNIQKNVKKTILFVSHDIDEALKLGDTIAIFREGKLMQFGRKDDILANPANEFVEEFIGSERMLKRMSLGTVGDLIRSMGGLSAKSGIVPMHRSNTVDIHTNLRTALSVVLSSPHGEAYVVDEEEKLLGVLRLADFNVYARTLSPLKSSG